MVSSKQIIAKVFRDFKPDNGSFVADAYEWIGEALEFIGVYSGLEKKSDEVVIENFRGSLPCDLHLISRVEHNGNYLKYGDNVRQHSFHRTGVTNPHASEVVVTAYETDPQNAQVFKEVSSATLNKGEFYQLNPGVINTSFESGTVTMHYMSLPIDKDCFPMVPDNQTVKEAITWYIYRQMMMGGYKHPVFNWQLCDAKWEEYCGKGQNDLMFPSPDKVHAWIDVWASMTPSIQHYDFNATGN